MAQAVFAPIGQPFCAWTQGSRKFAIQVHGDVLARLAMEVRVAFKRVPRRGLEIGGILLGRRERRDEVTTFWIEGFEAVESEHRLGPSYILSEPDLVLFRDAFTKNLASSIGIFRSQTRSQQLGLQEPDLQLFERCFDRADGLFLIACPVAARAAFFVREDGELKCVHEFGLGSPLGSSVAAQSSEAPLVAAAEVSPEAEVPSTPEIQPVLLAVSRPLNATEGEDQQPKSIADPKVNRAPGAELKRSARAARGMWPVAALLFSALLGAGIGMFSHTSRPSVISQVPLAEDLHLTAEGNAGRLRLYWDPHSSALLHPSRAVLHIQDGDFQTVKNISPAELSAGSVAYEPKGRDVRFRMEVSSPAASASGVVQVMNLSQPSVAPLAVAPAPAAEPSVKPPPKYQAPEAASNTASAVRSEAAAPSHAATAFGNDVAKDAAKDLAKDKESVPPIAARSYEGAEKVASVRRDAAPVTNTPVIAERPVSEPSIRVWPEAVAQTTRGRLIGKVPLLRRLRKPAKTSMPTPVFQALPTLTKPAKDTITRPASVDVKVDVGDSGLVEKAEVVQFSDPLNVAVTNSALAAAVRWTFKPARSEDGAVSSQVILHFRFTP